MFFDLDLSAAALIVTRASGARTVMSAGAPSASDPPGRWKTRAGLTDSNSTSRGQRDLPGVQQAVADNRHRRLEPDDAEGRAVELEHLLVRVVRRVVGGDHVDAAVGDAREHRVAVRGFAQRRVHLEVGVVLRRPVERLVGEREMVRRDLARDVHAALLAGAHGAQRLARAHVRDVDMAAGQLRQRDVALDHQRFGHAGNPAQAERRGVVALVRDAIALERRVLAVVDDRHAEHAGVLERAAHQQRRRHRPAVVGERDAPGGLLLAELGELIALGPERDGADRIHARELRFGRLLEDELRDPGVVVDRVGVRHARDRREPAGDGRRHAGGDRFLVLLPRLAQVDVDVDEARRHDPAALHLEHLGAVDRQVLADPRDRAVVDQDVERAVAAVGRIDDPPVLQQ